MEIFHNGTASQHRDDIGRYFYYADEKKSTTQLKRFKGTFISSDMLFDKAGVNLVLDVEIM